MIAQIGIGIMLHHDQRRPRIVKPPAKPSLFPKAATAPHGRRPLAGLGTAIIGGDGKARLDKETVCQRHRP